MSLVILVSRWLGLGILLVMGNPHVFVMFSGCQIGTTDFETVFNIEVGMYIEISRYIHVSVQNVCMYVFCILYVYSVSN